MLAVCLSPLAGLLHPRPSAAAADVVSKPATSLIPYDDTIILNQRRGMMLDKNTVFYPGCRKVVFNNKDYGVVVINSSQTRKTGDPLLERFEELLWKELEKF